MKRRVATVLVVPKTLHREGLARLLANTNYRPIRSVASIEELAHGPELAADTTLFIISWDALATDASHDALLPELQMLKRQYPNTRVLVLSDTFDVDDVVATLRAGANGYIMNTMTSDAMLKSLDLVMFGETVLASEFSRAVCERSSKLLDDPPRIGAPDPTRSSEETAAQHPDVRKLSSREAVILARLMQGASNKNIARDIGAAEATVKTHIKAIMRKLGVKNRTQAALWAFTNLQRPLVVSSRNNSTNGSIKSS